jgi:hypothetical protein
MEASDDDLMAEPLKARSAAQCFELTFFSHSEFSSLPWGWLAMLGVVFAFAFGFSWGHGLRSQRSKKKLPHSLGGYRPIYNLFICSSKRRLICLFQLVRAMGWPCGLAALSEKGMHDQALSS